MPNLLAMRLSKAFHDLSGIAQPSTSDALASAGLRDVSGFGRELVTPIAVSLAGMDSGGTDPAQHVRSPRHGLEMARLNAPRMPTEVVNNEPSRNGPLGEFECCAVGIYRTVIDGEKLI